MWKSQVLLLLLTILYNCSLIHGQDILPFKCAKDDDCEGDGATCSTDGAGTCSCGTTAPNLGNYDCGANSAAESIAPCTTDPTAGSEMCDGDNTFFCADNAALASCVCNAGFLTIDGESTKGCDKDRIQITCHGDGVSILLYTYKEIDNVHFQNTESDDDHTACTLTKDGTDKTKQEFQGGSNDRFKYDGSLDDPCNFAATENGLERKLKLYGQQGANYYSTSDFVLDITCTFAAAGDQDPVTSVVVTAAAPTPATLSRQASIELNAEMYLALLNALDDALAENAPLVATKPLALMIVFPYNDNGEGNALDDAFLKDAKIGNYDLSAATAPDSGAVVLDLVKDYCVEDAFAVRGLIKEKTTRSGDEVLRIQLTINVPYFPTVADGFSAGQSSVMMTVCINTGCTRDSGLDACGFTWTDAIVNPATAISGRKKRDVNSADERQKRDAEKEIPQNITSVLQFTVQDPNARTSIVVQTGSNDSQQDNCHQTMMFILPLALMGCLLLLSLVLLCFFYSKLRVMMGEQKHGSTNLAYKS